jgi:predicted signal transduction protein with EAL and GGDEF domain
VRVTLSVGVASAAGAAIEFGSMFESADRALYDAKKHGRNRVAFVPVVGGDRGAAATQPRILAPDKAAA